MGVSIMWRPVKNDGKCLNFGGRSKAMETITRLFGNPGKIKAEDREKLRAMAEATGEEGYDQLADALSEHDEIEVWGEY